MFAAAIVHSRRGLPGYIAAAMTGLDSRLEAARGLAAMGRLEEAAAAFRALQDVAPFEAAEFLGVYALRRQHWGEAVTLLERAAQLAPDGATTLENLGFAYLSSGALEPAADALRRAIELRPEFFVARLLLGITEHRLGHTLTGFVHMQWAFRQARRRGFWRDAGTTQPWMREWVREAATFCARYAKDTLFEVAAREGGGAPLPRIEGFIRAQLGMERAQSPDPRQQPKKHYLPGLPPSPWFDPGLFPWTARLKEAFPAILAEYLAVASGAGGGFESFLNFTSAEQVRKYLGTTGPAPEWNAYFFYRHGVRHDENCARCPRTAALLDTLPLIRLPGATPEVCFSILTPGSHILPHRGDSNLRSVVHLGLVVPDSCALNVAGEPRGWEPGGILAFDDTYEHEAWNRSDAVRAVLLMDAWNPHLTEEEKRVLPSVVDTMNLISDESERLKPPVA